MFHLQYDYGRGLGFSMDTYHVIEQHLDALRSDEVGEVLNKTYPNPCAEILIPVRELDDDKWNYREEQAGLRAAGFDAYNCDMVDEFPTW